MIPSDGEIDQMAHEIGSLREQIMVGWGHAITAALALDLMVVALVQLPRKHREQTLNNLPDVLRRLIKGVEEDPPLPPVPGAEWFTINRN